MSIMWITLKTAIPLIVKSKRRAVIAVLGLAIGVAVLSAEIIAIDSIMDQVIESNLDRINIDMMLRGEDDNYTYISDELESLEEIDRVEPVSITQIEYDLIDEDMIGTEVYHTAPYQQYMPFENGNVHWHNISLPTGKGMAEVYGLVEYGDSEDQVEYAEIAVYRDGREIVRSSNYLHKEYGETYYSLRLPYGCYVIECIPNIGAGPQYRRERHSVNISTSVPKRLDFRLEPVGETTIRLNGSVHNGYTGEKINDPEFSDYYYYSPYNYTEVSILVEGEDYRYSLNVPVINGSYNISIHEGNVTIYALRTRSWSYYRQFSEIITMKARAGQQIECDLELTKNHLFELKITDGEYAYPMENFSIYEYRRGIYDTYHLYPVVEYNYNDSVLYNLSANTFGLYIWNYTHSIFINVDFEPGRTQSYELDISRMSTREYSVRGWLSDPGGMGLADIRVELDSDNYYYGSGGESDSENEGYFEIVTKAPPPYWISIHSLELLGGRRLDQILHKPERIEYNHTSNPDDRTTIYGIDPNWTDADRLFHRYETPPIDKLEGNKVIINSFLARAMDVSVGDHINLTSRFYIEQNNSAWKELQRKSLDYNYYWYYHSPVQLDVILKRMELEIVDIIDLDVNIGGEKNDYENSYNSWMFLHYSDFDQYCNMILMDIDYVNTFLDGLTISVQEYLDTYGLSPKGFEMENVSMGIRINWPYYIDATEYNLKDRVGYFDSPRYIYCMWFDRDRMINIYDEEATIERIDDLQIGIRILLKDKSTEEDWSISGSDVTWIMERYSKTFTYAKLIIVGVSIPVIILALYLTIIGINLGEKELAREAAFYKTRGISNSQLAGIFAIQSVAFGLLASGIGIALGILLSFLFLRSDNLVNAIFFMRDGSLSSLGELELTISGSTILTIMVGSVIMMTVITARSIGRITKVKLSEALRLHNVIEYARGKYLFKLDVTLLSISVVAYASIIWMDDAEPLLFLGTFGSLLYIIISTISFAVSPLLPFFFGISVTRILTRKIRAPYNIAAIIMRPISGKLHPVVKKNLRRNPKRVSAVCIMIALSLCFGLYTLTIVESEYELEMTEVDIRYPADIMLLSYQGPELADNISAVEGIRECSPVTFIKQGTRRLSEMGEEMNLIFLDPDFILNHTTLEKGIFPEDDSNGLLESLKDPFNVIISRAHSRVDNLIVGDSINMYSWLDQLDIRSSYRYYENFTEDRRTNWDINLTVRGIFEDMPGLEIDEYTCAVIMSYGSLGRFLYNNTFIEKNEIDFKYSQETRYDFCSLLLIETRAGYDDTTIAEAIFAEYPFDTGNFRIKEERSSNLSGDRDSFVYLIGVEYGLILLISTIGLVFILWVSFSERRVETASMRARGASVGDIFRLFLSEALSYLAIGLIIGVVTGLISGIAYLRVIDDLTDPPYPREFIFSSTSLYMILLSCVFMIIIIVILATFMSGLSLGKTMRSRGD